MKSKEGEDWWRRLEVWKLADELARSIHHAAKAVPAFDLYTLTSQPRRAALSVPTNIVEGYSRGGDKELGRLLDIALGPLAETKYLILVASGILPLTNRRVCRGRPIL